VDLVLPTDVVVAPSVEATSGKIVPTNSVPAGEMALDVGPDTVKAFAAGTNGVAQALAQGSGFSVVGGGDSVAAIDAAGEAVRQKIGFISTGGGASLELIEGQKLPGVEALRA